MSLSNVLQINPHTSEARRYLGNVFLETTVLLYCATCTAHASTQRILKLTSMQTEYYVAYVRIHSALGSAERVGGVRLWMDLDGEREDGQRGETLDTHALSCLPVLYNPC